MGMAVYILTFGLFLIGLYAVIAKKSVVKIIVGVIIIEYAANLLLVLVGYRHSDEGIRAPILSAGEPTNALVNSAVDPLPQAMVITSIVIGLGLTALMVAMGIRLYEKYGTFDTEQMRKLRG